MRNEDTYWTGRALQLCKKIGWCDLSFYAYRKGHAYAQTSKPLSRKQVNDLSAICLNYCAEVREIDASDELKAGYYAFIAYPYTVWIGQSELFGKSKTDLESYVEMKKLNFLLRYDTNKNVRLVKWAHILLGYSNACKLCRLALKIKHKGITTSD